MVASTTYVLIVCKSSFVRPAGIVTGVFFVFGNWLSVIVSVAVVVYVTVVVSVDSTIRYNS